MVWLVVCLFPSPALQAECTSTLRGDIAEQVVLVSSAPTVDLATHHPANALFIEKGALRGGLREQRETKLEPLVLLPRAEVWTMVTRGIE